MPKQRPRVVVCAAIRNKTTGLIVCGPRHGNCFNFVNRTGVSDTPTSAGWDCGFVDQNNMFMTRDEAWKVARTMRQIRYPTGFEKDLTESTSDISETGLLFSENLY